MNNLISKHYTLVLLVILSAVVVEFGCGGGGGGGGSASVSGGTPTTNTTKSMEIVGTVANAAPGSRSFAPSVTSDNSSIEVSDEVNGASIAGASAQITGLNAFRVTLPLSSTTPYLVITLKDKTTGKTKLRHLMGRIPSSTEATEDVITVGGLVITEETSARAILILEDKTKVPDTVIAVSDTTIVAGQKSAFDVAVEARIANAATKIAEVKKAVTAVVAVLESSSVSSTVKDKIQTIESLAALLASFVNVAKEYAANDSAVKTAVGSTAPTITLGGSAINNATTTNNISTIIAAVKSEITTPPVIAPVFSPAAGTYTTAQSVAITCATSGATIKYTTDGSTPSATVGTTYTSAITISTTTTIKAIAVKSGMSDSPLAIGLFEIKPAVAPPVFSPVAGTYTEAQSVTITCATSGSVIKYTTDGSNPSANSSTYTSSISVTTTTTIKAIATKSGMTDSSVITGLYEIKPLVAAPVISPIGSQEYSDPQTITITCSTPNATIKYTIDGSEPSKNNGITYNEPFKIFQVETLKVIAYKDGFSDSIITTSNYNFAKTKVFNLGNNVLMGFKWINPGSFIMGKETDNKSRRFYITKGFWMAESECNQEQWSSITGTNPSSSKNILYPVESVTYSDVISYIDSLNNKKMGNGVFRLPTEAEWEYSCRAGKSWNYYGTWDFQMTDYAWVHWNTYNAYIKSTQREVRTRQPNSFGLYDMIGNVWEMCNDWYDETYIYTCSTVDQTGPSSGTEKVIRGYSYNGDSEFSPVTDRNKNAITAKYNDVGFRLVYVETY